MSETLKLTHNEPHDSSLAARLNWLRAGVLGANDGIVSVAATVVGVAGVTNQISPILVAGTAAVVGGAVSMALGEYVSVSSQSDSQRALIEKERQELRDDPDGELAELAHIYQAKGLSEATARTVAEELTRRKWPARGMPPSPPRSRLPSAPCCPCWPSFSRRQKPASR